MTCFGNFERGNLCLPTLEVKGIGGVQIPYRPGDIIFLRASVLEHFVSDFDGERSVFVLFTKNNC